MGPSMTMHYMDCGIAGGFPHPASAHHKFNDTYVLKAVQSSNGTKWRCTAQCSCGHLYEVVERLPHDAMDAVQDMATDHEGGFDV